VVAKKNGELLSEKKNTGWYQVELYQWVALHVQNHGLPFPSFPLFQAGLAVKVEKWGGGNFDGFLQAQDQNKAKRYRSMFSEVLRRVQAALDAGAEAVANGS